MKIKKLSPHLLVSTLLWLITTNIFSASGQTLQIHTHLNNLIGKPSWLLEIREVENGIVSPYIFDIENNDNFWLAFTAGRTYRIVASTLTFGPYAKIHNFCRLQNGIIDGKSMFISITGELSPDPHRFKCKVTKFIDMTPPIATQH